MHYTLYTIPMTVLWSTVNSEKQNLRSQLEESVRGKATSVSEGLTHLNASVGDRLDSITGAEKQLVHAAATKARAFEHAAADTTLRVRDAAAKAAAKAHSLADSVQDAAASGIHALKEGLQVDNLGLAEGIKVYLEDEEPYAIR